MFWLEQQWNWDEQSYDYERNNVSITWRYS